MNKTNSDDYKDDFIVRNIQKIVWILFSVGIIGILISIIVYIFRFANVDHEPWGQIGDFFGGVLNPFVTFLTLIAVLITLHIQRYEIKKIFQNKQIEKLEEIMKYLFEYYLIIQNDIPIQLEDTVLRFSKLSLIQVL
jgi:uncharacterized membrane protein